MKAKIVITALTMGLFTAFSTQAQDTKHDEKHEHMSKSTYICSMHPDVKMDKPGDCPKCGMTLIKKEMDHSKMDHSKMEKTYTCPMHSDVSAHKEGDCPKCGMKLVEKKMDHKKDGHDAHKH